MADVTNPSPSSPMTEVELRSHGLLDDNNKNSQCVFCPHCSCKIMLAGVGTYECCTPFFLPEPLQKNSQRDEDGGEGEDTISFWVLNDMFAFENIAFSKTVGSSTKFIACADCEVGPIGYHDITDTKRFYVAVNRVIYKAAHERKPLVFDSSVLDMITAQQNGSKDGHGGEDYDNSASKDNI